MQVGGCVYSWDYLVYLGLLRRLVNNFVFIKYIKIAWIAGVASTWKVGQQLRQTARLRDREHLRSLKHNWLVHTEL